MSVLATSRVSFWNRVANSRKSPMKKSVVSGSLFAPGMSGIWALLSIRTFRP